ncbi:imidazolonepropionase [Sphingobacterium shayense]|uniref:imidazolonepropionase n=1 Tax=Sphingobacterium shayense TaxID=626343 RepID=UPI00155729DE|nr:imidazolonepropionase [Sphingobacterium shayense]NQD70452.1 imidazolonepropionase [Sphingobacterium shayense]
MKKKLIGPFTQLLPMRDLPLRGSLADDQLLIISTGGIVVEGEKITDIGAYQELEERHSGTIEHIKMVNSSICLPAYVDCHTHIAFAGERSHDFALRNAGASYLEIAASGGGIWSTVQHTRKITFTDLVEQIKINALQLLRQGVTTIEVKSGYGLELDQEIKILQAIQQAGEQLPIELIPTCLAAHMKPRDYNGSASSYLSYVGEHLFPVLIREGLSNRIDAFVEQSAFSVSEITPYLQRAKDLGFDLTVHADQFSTGGSRLACELEAVSADHLEASSKQDIALLGVSNTVAVALPGASLGLGMNFAPCRGLLDAGASLAIATDWNPGSAPMGQLMTQAAILASSQKLSNAELFAAITYRAAKALNLTDRGSLKPGNRADFIVYQTNSYQNIPYHQGTLLPKQVWSNGQLVYQENRGE